MLKLLYFFSFLLFLMPNFSCAKSEQMGAQVSAGGPCTYKYYDGKATIVSVNKYDGEKAIGGPNYEQYEVRFIFKTDADLPRQYENVLDQEHSLLLMNSWHPGPAFIEKYGIQEGRTFDCSLGVIQKGACTPYVFNFSEIDRTDYFENSKR